MSNRRFPTTSGPSQRQLRVGELLRRTLADVLTRGDVHDPDLNRIPITVSEVRASPDLKIATAYVMPWAGASRKRRWPRCAATRPNCATLSAAR